MPRTVVQIESDIATVHDAINELMKTGAEDVGLRNSITIDGQGGGKMISGQRASLPQMRDWLAALDVELAAAKTPNRPRAGRSVYSKDL